MESQISALIIEVLGSRYDREAYITQNTITNLVP